MQGEIGATGAQGPAGPATSQRITSTPQTSVAAPVKGTTVTATAACPTGKVVLGGGGQATENATPIDQTVHLQQSWPRSTTTWTVVGVVNPIDLTGSARLTVTAYALCTP